MPVLTKINTNSIAEDAITGDKFAGDAYLSNTATQNISGTYSENRLYTSDAYTLSGNATVNSHLTLSSIKPTADVVLTAGGAYTLTGTGVLSGGSLLPKEGTSLTGMTGELGTTITGSPALNLNNATQFPAGHQLQMVRSINDLGSIANHSTNTHTFSTVLPYVNIVPKASNSVYHMFGKMYGSWNTSEPILSFAVSTDGGTTYKLGSISGGSGGIGSGDWGYGSAFTWGVANGEWTFYFEDWYESPFSAGQANIRFTICHRNYYHASTQNTYNICSPADHAAHLIVKEIAT